MPYVRTVPAVEAALLDAFAALDAWFDRPVELRGHLPAGGGWSIDQVLEHVSLTNHFLLLTLRKFVGIATRRAKRAIISEGESDLARLDVIGQRGSFGWPRPAHMEPTGRPAADVRALLKLQLAECLDLLRSMGRGEGSLCRVTMTVNRLGKIDLYQWAYFIAQHARRHLQQMAALEDAYRLTTAPNA
jgi:hypothetical protein